MSNTKDTSVPGRWPIDKARAWYDAQPWLIGCNYIPANAINQLEMWQADTFDLATMDRELGWAQALGFNTQRVFLHDLLWGDDSEGLYERMDRFLALCQKHGMRILFVFFDDCHRTDPVLGVQPPCVKAYHNSGWVTSPTRELLIRYHDGTARGEERQRLQGYVQETMRRFADDERILAWELYNEPGRVSENEPALAQVTVPLLQDAWRWAREVAPSQPVCSTAEGSLGDVYIEIARANSDIISFHSYLDHELEDIIQAYGQTGRPVMCTEYMARPKSTFQQALPILKKHRVAAYNWGFVSGKSGTIWPWSSRDGKDVYQLREQADQIVQPGEAYPEPAVWFHDIYREDGSPYAQEEIDFIKALTTTGS